MKISLIGKPEIIMSNPLSKHHYFAWPSLARLKNGKIAAVASGFRLQHICPFGKTVIVFSEDEGKTYTAPAPVMDTPLDDRDGGLCPFGKNSLIVTSFNNTVDFQRKTGYPTGPEKAYADAYLDLVTPEEEAACLGATFRISHDNGVTFGPLMKSPVTSPHGPLELPDGSLLWVGRTFSKDIGKSFRALMKNVPGDQDPIEDQIMAIRMDADGTMEYRGAIAPIYAEGQKLLSCEPHAIRLPDGRILCQIRAQSDHHIRTKDPENAYFTLYQSISEDEGCTWSEPEKLLSNKGGAPAHLMMHSSGLLISAYGYRKEPTGIKLMLSKDLGRTWEKDLILYTDGVNKDLGYPATVELKDGSLATVFYAHTAEDEPAVIWQQKWRIEE